MALSTPLPGSPAASGRLVFTVPDPGNPVVVPTVLLGFGVAETAGSTASFRLRDGTTVAAPPLMPLVTLSANQSTREWFSDQGIQITSGAVYLQIVSGAIEGNIFWGP